MTITPSCSNNREINAANIICCCCILSWLFSSSSLLCLENDHLSSRIWYKKIIFASYKKPYCRAKLSGFLSKLWSHHYCKSQWYFPLSVFMSQKPKKWVYFGVLIHALKTVWNSYIVAEKILPPHLPLRLATPHWRPLLWETVINSEVSAYIFLREHDREA